MAGPALTAILAAFVVAQADAPAPPAPVAVPITSEPTTRFGEACLLAARRTLSGRYEFRLSGVEDRTTVGERETWIDYQAVRIDSGTVHEESFGCLFVTIDSPDSIVLEAAGNNRSVLGAGALEVLNQELAAAGFQPPAR
ncbi:MAG: hypothetical protein IT535_02580 [Bauldia sp.]|nr:hypothetical protein [Bauldia sp.]